MLLADVQNSNRCLVIFPRANRSSFNFKDWVGLPPAEADSLQPNELVGPLAILTLAALCSLVRYHEAWRFARLVHKVGLSKRALARREAEAAEAVENQPGEPQPTSSNAILFTALPEPSLVPEQQAKDQLNVELVADYKRMLLVVCATYTRGGRKVLQTRYLACR